MHSDMHRNKVHVHIHVHSRITYMNHNHVHCVYTHVQMYLFREITFFHSLVILGIGHESLQRPTQVVLAKGLRTKVKVQKVVVIPLQYTLMLWASRTVKRVHLLCCQLQWRRGQPLLGL